MMKRWKDALVTAVGRLSTRERALLLLTLMALTYVLAQALFLSPLNERQIHLNHAVEHARVELARLERAEALLARSAALHPNARLRQILARVRAERAKVDAELRAQTSGLVPASRMEAVIHRLLVAEPTLTLTRLVSHPATPLLATDASSVSTAPSTPSPTPPRQIIYVHTLSLGFRGRYGATLAYLEALEHLPWGFYWDRLSLHMRHYPVARVHLVVHTLGLRRALFAPR